MRKEKLRKVELCFISGCFIKPFKMIINHFLYFSSSFAAQFWFFDIRNIKRGNWERQVARNSKLNIFFKHDVNLLIMNATQFNFLTKYFYWQNVVIWHFIKVNYKRSLLFVVVSKLMRWSKTIIFTDYNDEI